MALSAPPERFELASQAREGPTGNHDIRTRFDRFQGSISSVFRAPNVRDFRCTFPARSVSPSVDIICIRIRFPPRIGVESRLRNPRVGGCMPRRFGHCRCCLAVIPSGPVFGSNSWKPPHSRRKKRFRARDEPGRGIGDHGFMFEPCTRLLRRPAWHRRFCSGRDNARGALPPPAVMFHALHALRGPDFPD